MAKGISMNQIPQVLMIVMLIGIFIGATYITLEAFQGSQYNATTVTNETINFAVNNTDYSFANPFLTGIGAVSKFGNLTYTVPSTQYQVTNTAYQTYKIKIFANGTIGVGNYNVTYQYNAPNKATAGIGYVIAMLDALVTNLPTVGIMIFIGILLSVVFWMVQSGKIGGKKKDGGA